jgi:beta-RFAP synthase
MVSVHTASRLHFGLLSLAGHSSASASAIESGGGNRRRFGGVGLMVEEPSIRVAAAPAPAWSASGAMAERVLAFAHRFSDAARARKNHDMPGRFIVETSTPEHVGLGTGTQLGLAVGRCLAAIRGLEVTAVDIATLVGRGERSAIGVHGFEHGGLVVESGQTRPGTVGALVARYAFPSHWRVLLIRPVGARGMHGVDERSALAIVAAAADKADVLCRLVLLGLLPALVEGDIDNFGEALFEFNVRAGEPFATVQGGTYSSAAVTELVSFLRSLRVRGVGQSSWGPTVFAIAAHEEHARELAGTLRRKYADTCHILVTCAANRGARLEVDVESR